jgi:hypothetical protein
VRTASKAAAVYIHAAGAIETKPLYFIMRRVGYTMSPNTLTSVLTYEPWVVRTGWVNVPRRTRTVKDELASTLDLARGVTLRDILNRAEAQVESELAEYWDRVNATVRGGVAM